MSRLSQSVAHVVRTNHLPAVAAVVMALLLAACATARSSPAESVAAAGTASPRATSIATSTAAARSPSPTPQPLPTAAHRPQTIHVIEEPISFASILIRGCKTTGGCVGDQLTGRSLAVDAATHENVGELIYKCVMTDPSRNLYDCAIAITLTGRGQIVFDETVVIGGNGPQGPWPIISGTGEFLGATGSVSIPADSTCHCGNFVIAITG